MVEDRPLSKTYRNVAKIGQPMSARHVNPGELARHVGSRAWRSWNLVYHQFLLRFHVPGDRGMKCLIVYYMNGQWIGEEVFWKRSGSGTYREVSRIEIPQSKAQIEVVCGRKPLRDRMARQDPGRYTVRHERLTGGARRSHFPISIERRANSNGVA